MISFSKHALMAAGILLLLGACRQADSTPPASEPQTVSIRVKRFLISIDDVPYSLEECSGPLLWDRRDALFEPDGNAMLEPLCLAVFDDNPEVCHSYRIEGYEPEESTFRTVSGKFSSVLDGAGFGHPEWDLSDAWAESNVSEAPLGSLIGLKGYFVTRKFVTGLPYDRIEYIGRAWFILHDGQKEQRFLLVTGTAVKADG